jgi:hypothetical protein
VTGPPSGDDAAGQPIGAVVVVLLDDAFVVVVDAAAGVPDGVDDDAGFGVLVPVAFAAFAVVVALLGTVVVVGGGKKPRIAGITCWAMLSWPSGVGWNGALLSRLAGSVREKIDSP